ncbi:N-6 DNA methylase [Streptomyces griseoaurantiacus]|uniref:N-6 DNA methylase n=1 Tax=Streptomyces griseoaurantiacus TaxID=68213 RepID=A0A7W2DS42_9ACTN|nr:N-6 DNA methylase [Streptomyces griseoaurantiacus]MBA5221931.1 N-6 DNA methylase [Streptomyces griseoaurantiacus]
MSTPDAVPVSLAEIARIAGVGRAAVSNWRRRHDSFPTRIGGTDVSPQFSLAEVENWLRENGKLKDIDGRELLWPRFEALGSRDGSGLAVADAARRMRSPRKRSAHPGLPAEARELVEEAAKLGRKEGPRETFEFLLQRWLDTHVRQLSTTPPPLAALMTRIALAVRLAEGRANGEKDGGGRGDGTGKTGELTVLDPACGTGHLPAAVAQEYDGPRVRVLACERDPALAALAGARLGFLEEENPGFRSEIATADALRADPFAGTNVDLALCNPPFNERDWGYEELATDQRWTHGLPPRTEPELAWVQHLLSHLAPGGSAVVVLPPAVASRKAGRRIRGSLLRTGMLRAVVALPPGSAQPHSVSLQLWVLRSAPDGGSTLPPSQDALFVDATRFARPGARDPGPDWDALGAYVLSAVELLDQPDGTLPGSAVRVPLLDLLDDEVDVTPGRHTATGVEPSGRELTEGWRELQVSLEELTGQAGRLAGLAFDTGTPRTTVTVGDLVKAGALTLRAGQQPSESKASSGATEVPLLTVADLLMDGTPGGPVTANPAHTLAEEGDIVVAGVVRAYRAWVHEGPPVALGPQLFALRVDPDKLDAHFLAGCLRAPANGRQAGTHASSSSRVDIRRLQVLQLPLAEQAAHAEVFRRLRQFETLLAKADGLGRGLVSDAGDRIAAGGLIV